MQTEPAATDPTTAFANDALLEDVAARFRTPTYLYDLTQVTRQVASLRRAFPRAQLRYAVKANANGALLRHLAGLGVGAEALTWGELERALRAGFEPGAILLGGPGHTPALARRAADAGVRLVSLDGEGAYDVWRDVLHGAPADVRFLVRLNPGFDPHTHEHLATAAATSKFGVEGEAAAALAERVAAGGRLAGFHVHAGSMLADPAVATLVVNALEPLYRRFAGLQLVDLGGGFAVPDAPLAEFAAAYGDFARRHGLTPIIEPGRYVVAAAGVLLTRVLHVKEGERRHVIADAGMSDLLRPALYGARHPVRLVASSARSAAPTTSAPAPAAARAPSAAARSAAETPSPARATDVDGPLCENADRLAQDVDLAAVRTGDLLAVGDAGAYGFAMASNYASSLRPAEVVWDGATLRLARRRERPEDLWRLEEEATEA